MENKQSNTGLIVTLIVSIIILIAIVTVGTYSFYTTMINQSNTEEHKTNVTSAELDFEIVDGTKTVESGGIIPGDTVTKNFSIKNNGNVTGTYKLVWKSVVNNFVNQNDLIVTLSEDGTEIISASDNKTFPASTTNPIVLKDGLSIPKNTTKNYTLTITYKNTENDQFEDMGKTFSAVIDMEV